MLIHFEKGDTVHGIDVDKIAEWAYYITPQTIVVRYGSGDTITFHGYQAEAIYRLLLSKSRLIQEDAK